MTRRLWTAWFALLLFAYAAVGLVGCSVAVLLIAKGFGA